MLLIATDFRGHLKLGQLQLSPWAASVMEYTSDCFGEVVKEIQLQVFCLPEITLLLE